MIYASPGNNHVEAIHLLFNLNLLLQLFEKERLGKKKIYKLSAYTNELYSEFYFRVLIKKKSSLI